MAVPFINASTGKPINTNVTSNYGGLGNIYQYGAQNPYGPYAGLNKAPGVGGTGGSSSTSGSSGPSGTAQQFLNGVMAGDKLPYSPDRVNQLYSQASDTNAAAENALNDRMDANAAAGGASASDPSRQGGKLNTMARRQTANQTSKRDINQVATGANFDAQLKAASMMEQTRLEEQRLAAGQTSQALGYMYGGGGGRSQQPAQQSTFVGGYGGNRETNYRDPNGVGNQRADQMGFSPSGSTGASSQPLPYGPVNIQGMKKPPMSDAQNWYDTMDDWLG